MYNRHVSIFDLFIGKRKMSNLASSEISSTLFSENFEHTLSAARGGNSDSFSQLTEPYRPELRAHCYRMLGSIEDAEDLVQETFLRAWRRLETYQGRASFRAWLYKIATNASLDALEHLPRRTLPLESENSEGVMAAEKSAGNEPAWIEPFPDLWLAASSTGPEARYEAYESISLAFLVALQILPPRQRTVLILADVMDWAVAEIADVLGISVSATTSLLRRARVTMKERNQSGKLYLSKVGIQDNQTRQILDQYARAWESADLNGIISLLADDAIFPMPPTVLRKQALIALYTDVILAGDTGGRWKLVPIHANGQPGFAFYRLDDETHQHQAFALQVLTIKYGLVVSATTFGVPALFPYFGLPATL
ncbi:MAG: sigma-70 family RNA polymerase sigma factor [Methylococcales bacterium]|nr:MAG: sigma-70 family RNA polymerase sigma factor [Methylococcales bacterium]